MKEKNIFKLIEDQYEDMSKTNKKIANFVKKNLHTVPFMTISELGENIKVGDASITRFTRQLGFAGYADFQDNAIKLVKKDVTPIKEVESSISSSKGDNILINNINNNLDVLSKLYTDDLMKNFNTSIDTLANARKIYILGARSSHGIAHYLYTMLKGFVEEVHLLSSGTEDISNILLHVRKEDVLLAVSYARYIKFTIEIAEYFNAKGSKIIALTDSYSAPISQLADSVLLAKNPENGYSFVNAMVIANSIVKSLGVVNEKETQEKLEEQLAIAMEKGIYL